MALLLSPQKQESVRDREQSVALPAPTRLLQAMTSSRQHKKAAESVTEPPLSNAGILQLVLSYVGPGHCFFIGTVCKAWWQCYKRVPDVRVKRVDFNSSHVYLACTSYMTLLRAATASESRLRLAHCCGLQLSTWRAQRAVGFFGDQETISTARELSMPLSVHVSRGAARSGELAKLQWLLLTQGCPEYARIGNSAAWSGSIGMLMWLKEHRGLVFDADTVNCAAAAGHWRLLQLLRNEGCVWQADTCAAAAEGGHLAVLQQLRQHGIQWAANTIAVDAAYSGDVQLLQWIREQDSSVVLDEEAFEDAAASGLAMCKYLHAEQCPCDNRACTAAAADDQLDTLKWLIESDCPWSPEVVLTAAAHAGNIGMLKYLRDQGAAPVTVKHRTEMLNAAGANGRLAAAKWLKQDPLCEWPAVLQYAYPKDENPQQWHGATLDWARAAGCTSPLE
jgi:hypothetical protein